VKTIRTAFVVAGLVIIASALLLTVHVSSNALEFSRFNTGWNGTSSFFGDIDRHHETAVYDPSGIASSAGPGLLLIIAPERQPGSQEISAYRAFLARGNTIILADDFGTGNKILNGIGSSVSILPGNLSSVDREYADPYSVVVYGVSNGSFVTTGTKLVTNRPAAIDGGTPLLMSSALSWIDTNGDKKINSDEAMGNFAVMVHENVGAGNLIVLSDPSIFTNAMYDAPENQDNRNLIHAVVKNNGTIFLDQMNSRTADAEGISAIVGGIRSNLGFNVLFVFILVLVVMLAWRYRIL